MVKNVRYAFVQMSAVAGLSLFALAGCDGSLESSDVGGPVPLDDQGRPIMPGPGFDGGVGSGDMPGPIRYDDQGMVIPPGQDMGVVGEMGVMEPDMRPPCRTPEAVFEREVWPKVAKPVCLGCHVSGGSAEQAGASFILKDESSISGGELTIDEFFAHNLEQFKGQNTPLDGRPRYLAKALGTQHGGGVVAPEGSIEHEALLALTDSLERGEVEVCEEPAPIQVLEHVQLLDAPGTLRKASMMLAGRLPTAQEIARLDGLTGEEAFIEVENILREDVMRGVKFRQWLKYAWNEIFHFRGTWQLDVTFPFQIVSGNDYRARRWGFINSAGAPDCDESAWVGDTTPLWQRFAYGSLAECQDAPFRRNYLSQRVAWSLIEEPLELIAWVVMTDRPFTDIMTTDRVMMNYYSSIAYYGSAQPDNNLFIANHGDNLTREVIEHPAGSVLDQVELTTLHTFRPMGSTKRSRQRRNDQDNLELFYVTNGGEDIPRSGILTSQIFLNRYPSTATNLNRHRAWSYFLNFLGVDILALADRRGDPAAAELGSDQPTIDDANCNVCHNVMDPIAGLFQDFGNEGQWTPGAPWPTRGQPNIIPPGSSIVGLQPQTEFTEAMDQMTTPMEWLGEQTISDPRFASRMVRHAFVQLTGHEPLELPLDTDRPGWQGRRVAYEEQATFLAGVTEGFVQRDFDMKWVITQLIISPWYRAEGVQRPESLDDTDVAASVSEMGDGDQLLTPEELHRKIEAILERPWQHTGYVMRGNRLNVIDENDPGNDYLLRYNSENDFRYIDPIFRDMYGGIDFFNNTERLTLPSSVMSAVGRRVSNELGCGVVAPDFALASADRIFFGGLTAQDTLQSNPDGVREAIERLMTRMWGKSNTADIDLAVALFDSVQTQGAAALDRGDVAQELLEHCQATARLPGQPNSFTAVTMDPTYSLRAWSAVVSYLALDPKFLYTW